MMFGPTHTQYQKVASEEALYGIVQASPLTAWILDPNTNCTYVNEACLEFSGRTLAQKMGRGWLQDVYPDNRKTCFGAVSGAYQGHRIYEVRFRFRRADGRYVWTVDHAMPVLIGGKFRGYVGSSYRV